MSENYNDDDIRITRVSRDYDSGESDRSYQRNRRQVRKRKQNNSGRIIFVAAAFILIAVLIFSIVRIAALSKDAKKHNELVEKYATSEQELESKLSKYDDIIAENEDLKKENEALKKENESQKKQIERQAKIANGIPFTNEEKTVYLTFDDGPSLNTLEILKILKKYGVQATFFVIDNGKYNYIMKDIVDSGNAIALHSDCHDYEKIYKSTDAFLDDLQGISDIVKQETGVESKIARFPGGASNTISRKYCEGIMTTLVTKTKENGYYYYDWNVDSQDASDNNVPVSTIVESATQGIYYKYTDNLIILMHDAAAKTTTVEALPKIIEAYQEAGIKFGVLDESVPIYLQKVNN